MALAAATAFTLHEMAHYLVATISGVNAESVIIGYGREIWHRQGGNGTRWSVRLFPVCGRVHLYAHSAAEAAAGPQRKLFTQQPWPLQVAIVAAGPLGNIITAFVALALFFTAAGLPSTQPVVDGIRLGGPASKAGILPGDRIITVDGKPVTRFETVRRATVAGKSMILGVQRGTRVFDATLIPELLSWRDTGGFARARGMAGILAMTAPFGLSMIDAIDGVPVAGDADKARRLLMAKLGSTARLTARVDDKTARDYLVQVPRPLNLALVDPAPVQGIRLSDGTEPFFEPASPLEAVREAAYETRRLTRGFVFILAHTWPFDVARIKPETTVSARLAPWRADGFVLAHKVAEWSIVLAVLNLFPVPGTDGWFILYIVTGAIAGWRRAPRLHLLLIQLTLFALLASWAIINLPVMLTLGH